jgi:hypothetical protein
MGWDGRQRITKPLHCNVGAGSARLPASHSRESPAPGKWRTLARPDRCAIRPALPPFATEDPADNVGDEKHHDRAQSNGCHDEPRLGRPGWKTVHRNQAY